MQYDGFGLSIGLYNGAGISMGVQTYSINSYINTISFAIKPPNSSINSIKFMATMSGTITNSAHKCYIVESILGKLYHIATVSTANDTLTLANYHNIEVNDRIVLFGTTMPTNTVRGDVYWVVNVTGNNIKISTTQGGTAIDFIDTGTNVCVSKYVDHSELTSNVIIESTRREITYSSFTNANLSNDTVYNVMILNLESLPSTNYLRYLTLGGASSNGINTWNIRQFTANLTTLTRSYIYNMLEHKITYANGLVDDMLVGYLVATTTHYVGNGSDIALGNEYKNNTNTKLYIRSIIANGQIEYTDNRYKNNRYVAKIHDKTTKELLATSIPLKPYDYAISGIVDQYFYFEFENPFEWSVNSEIIIMIHYLDGGYNDLTCRMRLKFYPINDTYYSGFTTLYKTRGRTEGLLIHKKSTRWAFSTAGGWTDNTSGVNGGHYAFELQFDTANPTGNVSGGGGLTEFVGFG